MEKTIKKGKLNENDLLKGLEYGKSMWTREGVVREQVLAIEKFVKATGRDFSEKEITKPFLEKIASVLKISESDNNISPNSFVLLEEIKKNGIRIELRS